MPTGVRVLCIDDDELWRAAGAAALERAGFVVAELDSGYGFAAAVRKFRPDIVVLDLNMPGLNGPAALDAARKVLVRWKIECPRLVLCSAVDYATLNERGDELGAIAVVSKAGGVRRLRDVVEMLKAKDQRAVKHTG